jgi:hypothetical protein
MKGMPWHWVTTTGSMTTVPNYQSITVSSLALYHPLLFVLRTSNMTQFFRSMILATLKSTSRLHLRNVILIPLKSSNIRDESSDFFNVIAKNLPSIQEPLDIGVYAETDIPTGNNWNLRAALLVGPTRQKQSSRRLQTHSLRWVGASDYEREEFISRDEGEISW